MDIRLFKSSRSCRTCCQSRRRRRGRITSPPTPLPTLACDDVGAPWLSAYGSPWNYDPEIQLYFMARREKLANARVFQMSESGPELPLWRIALFSVGKRYQRQTDAPDSTSYFEIESENIRPIRMTIRLLRYQPISQKQPFRQQSREGRP